MGGSGKILIKTLHIFMHQAVVVEQYRNLVEFFLRGQPAVNQKEGRFDKTLTEIQKSKANKIIHQGVSKQPYLCQDCHQKEAPLLPFAELGYPQHKIDAFVSTEVIGMIKKYSQFYLPSILDLDGGSSAPQD